VGGFKAHIIRLMSLLYAESIARLCDGMELERLDLSGLDMCQLEVLDEPENSDVKIELIVHWIQRIVVDNMSAGVVTAPAPITSRVFNELSNGVVRAQAARKIKNIQFPFHYAQMLSTMLVVYSCGVPVMCAYIMSTYWGAAGSTFINVFVLWCVNYLAVEIEQPFGERPNDLPVAAEMKAMNDALRALASRVAMDPPRYSGNCRASLVTTEQVSLEGGSTLQASKSQFHSSGTVRSCCLELPRAGAPAKSGGDFSCTAEAERYPLALPAEPPEPRSGEDLEARPPSRPGQYREKRTYPPAFVPPRSQHQLPLPGAVAPHVPPEAVVGCRMARAQSPMAHARSPSPRAGRHRPAW